MKRRGSELNDVSLRGATPSGEPAGRCRLCGDSRSRARLPFAVGRQDSPPFPREYRLFLIGPRRKKFVQRFRWVWHSLSLCRECLHSAPSEKLWNAIQNHAQARALIDKGYTETRLDPQFSGRDGDITSSEETL